MASCINLKLPIILLKKSILLDMHRHKTYRYINFQQYRVNRSVITLHTNVFAKNRKLHKLSTTNSNFKKLTLSDMRHRETHMYINFRQNRVSRSVKMVRTNLIAKNANCINLQLAIRILKNTPFGHALRPNGHSGRI